MIHQQFDYVYSGMKRACRIRCRHRSFLLPTIVLIMAAVILSGCCAGTAQQETFSLPPITAQPGGETQVGALVWFELLSEALPEAQRFYEELFGWEFEASAQTPDYWLIRQHGETIGGMLALPGSDPEAPESLWLCSLSVADVDQAVDALLKQGGTVLEGPRDVSGRGRMAIVQDAQGAPLAFLRADGGDPLKRAAGPGTWFWADLVTRDKQIAGDFYTTLLGVEVQTITDDDGQTVDLLLYDGRPRAGLVEIDLEGVMAHWLPYVRVTDLEATIARTAQLGGSLILRQGDIAILTDPSGAAIGVKEHHAETKGGQS